MWVLGYTPIKIIMVVMAKMGALLVRVQFLAMGHQSLMFPKKGFKSKMDGVEQ